jgi:hypothetical protein
MLREIFRLSPRIENSDLQRMESSLNQRFARVARRFGRGLLTAIRGGGWIGIAVGALNKILNPLKETQATIDRLLNQGNDLVTNAEQFNTTAGKLFKLQTFAKATGVEESQLFDMMRRFQSAVSQAEADPTKKTSVSQFVGASDMADAFFEFIQSLNKMERNQQVLVQREVFGEKQTLRMADFLRSDFERLTKTLGLGSSDRYTKTFERSSGLAVLDRELRARRESKADVAMAKEITEGIIRARDAQGQRDLDQERKRIKSYEDLDAINSKFDTLIKGVENGLSMLGKLTIALEKILGESKISKWLRGVAKDYKGPWEK